MSGHRWNSISPDRGSVYLFEPALHPIFDIVIFRGVYERVQNDIHEDEEQCDGVNDAVKLQAGLEDVEIVDLIGAPANKERNRNQDEGLDHVSLASVEYKEYTRLISANLVYF